jgi:hypothetical protein
VNMSSVLAGIFYSSIKSHLLTRFLFLQAYSIIDLFTVCNKRKKLTGCHSN